MKGEAPDWFGCGRTITTESWNKFLAAREAHYAAQDAAAGIIRTTFANVNINHSIPTNKCKPSNSSDSRSSVRLRS